MDLFSRRLMSDTIDSQLVQSAMRMALADRNPSAGVIHHSDRGVQYACDDFQKLLKDNRAVVQYEQER